MIELIEKLQAMKGPSREIDAQIFWIIERRRATIAYWNATVGKPRPLGDEMPKGGLGRVSIEVASPYYTRSIDDAMRLIPKGASWTIETDAAWVRWLTDADIEESQGFLVGRDGACTAIAVCIAALKARNAQATSDNHGAQPSTPRDR